MSFEQARVYTTSVLPGQGNGDDLASGDFAEVRERFRKFVLGFYTGNTYVYRDQLRENVLTRYYTLQVNVAHLLAFDEELGGRLNEAPSEVLPVFEGAALDVAKRITGSDEIDTGIPSIQVTLESSVNPLSIRDLTARHITKLVRIPGIIISASPLSSKATSLQLMCRNCRNLIRHEVPDGFAGLQLPSRCQGASADGSGQGSNDCPPNPYVVVHDRSGFVDQQVLKLQESPEMVPVGELPRNILLTVDRTLCNRAIPGTRATALGVYSIYQNRVRAPGAVAIRNPYVRVVGLEITSGHHQEEAHFTDEEEEEFLQMARTPDFFQRFSRSIAPSIFGHEEIKEAIACLLVGGTRRILPDGMRLRGDINVLLLGDPGTAKSQLLKFVEKVSPIAIYTSGKGSSAAGLTASVQRDAGSRDFYLEGGAMVLADGGVVCIDEFDKMREEDRVAIHEAMEQQTISIAKAGITTVLNSRTSVLAAANPLFGRYDELKAPGENIDFQTTILSRFDMIFIIKDEHRIEEDREIARFVVNTHMHGGRATTAADVEGEIPLAKMKRYIGYCRSRMAPRLSPSAAEALAAHFVNLRKQVHDRELQVGRRSTVPVTVRQLEALVRISESIAKLELSVQVEERHVAHAVRLFNASTQRALDEERDSGVMSQNVQSIEQELKRRLPIGWSTSRTTLVNEFTVTRHHFKEHELDAALYAMERRDTIQLRHQGQNVFRSGP